MKIALDVDGVLADVIVSWLNYSNSIRPSISKNQVTDWEFWKNWQSIPTTQENLSDITKNLSILGQVDIVTARERSTDSFVKNWLNYHDISYDNYISVIDGPMKADLDYDVFIDDSPLNAIKFLENHKKVILYSQPWNQHISNDKLFRISNLSEAIEKIKLY